MSTILYSSFFMNIIVKNDWMVYWFVGFLLLVVSRCVNMTVHLYIVLVLYGEMRKGSVDTFIICKYFSMEWK